jgi:hypothetical protein
MISRPPSRTTRAFDVRSFWPVTIFFEAREAPQGIQSPAPSWHNHRDFRGVFADQVRGL